MPAATNGPVETCSTIFGQMQLAKVPNGGEGLGIIGRSGGVAQVPGPVAKTFGAAQAGGQCEVRPNASLASMGGLQNTTIIVPLCGDLVGGVMHCNTGRREVKGPKTRYDATLSWSNRSRSRRRNETCCASGISAGLD